mmetsp:Transcript_98506/g.283176  ORF Transcript_98506/g.283176 Transcript_98506/m.283176 type:complete len:206 (+) Transcript_98506:637-1254(+)
MTHASRLLPSTCACRIFAKNTKRTGIWAICSNECTKIHHLSGLSQLPQRVQCNIKKMTHAPHTTTLPHPENIMTVLMKRDAAKGSRRTTSTKGSSLPLPVSEEKKLQAACVIFFHMVPNTHRGDRGKAAWQWVAALAPRKLLEDRATGEVCPSSGPAAKTAEQAAAEEADVTLETEAQGGEGSAAGRSIAVDSKPPRPRRPLLSG